MRDRKDDQAHRRIAATKLGRKLAPHEVVDHINEDKRDNSPANLAVESRAAHTRHHAGARSLSRLRASLRMVKEGKRLY